MKLRAEIRYPGCRRTVRSLYLQLHCDVIGIFFRCTIFIKKQDLKKIKYLKKFRYFNLGSGKFFLYLLSQWKIKQNSIIVEVESDKRCTLREINSHHDYNISRFFPSNKNLEFDWNIISTALQHFISRVSSAFLIPGFSKSSQEYLYKWEGEVLKECLCDERNPFQNSKIYCQTSVSWKFQTWLYNRSEILLKG